MNKFDVKIVTTKKRHLNWYLRPSFKRQKSNLGDGPIAIKKVK